MGWILFHKAFILEINCVIYWVLVECTYTLYIILYMYYYYIYNIVYYCIPFHLQLVINLYIILITSDACAIPRLIPRVVGRQWINVLVPRPSKACSQVFHKLCILYVWYLPDVPPKVCNVAIVCKNRCHECVLSA